ELTEDFLLVSLRRLAFSAYLLRTRPPDPASVAAELQPLRRQSATLNSLYLVSAGGTLLASAPHDPQRTVERLSAGSQEILLRREPLVSRPFMSRSGRLVVALAHPLFDDQRQFLGYLGGSMYLRESSVLNRMLGKHYHRDGSYLY